MPDMGSVPVAKPVVIRMFQKTNKDEIQDMVTTIGKNAIKDTVLFMKGNIDIIIFQSGLRYG